MTTKFNVGDWVYATELTPQNVIFARIHSIEITEKVFGLERLENFDFEGVNKKQYIDSHTKKSTIVTYVFKIQDNIIKIPEWLYLYDSKKNEVTQIFPLVFSKFEEVKKYFANEMLP